MTLGQLEREMDAHEFGLWLALLAVEADEAKPGGAGGGSGGGRPAKRLRRVLGR